MLQRWFLRTEIINGAADIMHELSEYGSEPFIGSIGFFRTFVDGTEHWLCFSDDDRQQYHLLQARRQEGESFMSCLHQEIERMTGLDRSNDYIISGLSVAHHQAPIEWSDGEPPQWVIVQFFPIQLYGSRARSRVEHLENTRWFTLTEIAQGQTTDRKPFNRYQRALIERADLLPAYLQQ
jgi:hypothetical protein